MRAAPVQRTILSTRRIMVPPLTLCANMKKGPNLRWSLIQCSGGDEGDRTPDLLTASQALSQLSYAPVREVLYGNSDHDARTILEKLSGGAGAGVPRGRDGGDRRPRGRCGRAALPPPAYQAPLRSPPGSPPRNRPIYYVWATSPDHGASGRNKTAGRRPAVFAKYGVWSRGRG